MPAQITMPKLGLTMSHGTLSRWLKKPGEAVVAGEAVVEVATDKITYEVASPASGRLAQTSGRDGDEFECGAVIGTIALEGERDDDEASGPAQNGARIIASPAARKMAREHALPMSGITGTGPRGRITRSDVLARVAQHAAAVPVSTQPPLPPLGTLPPELPRERRTIYRRMSEIGTLPLAQVSLEARADGAERAVRAARVKWTAFGAFACARALREHPVLRTDAASGAPAGRISIGVAMHAPSGLLVPVVRDADRLRLGETEAEIARLATLAREGRLGLDDLAGATFALSNVGPFAVDGVTPLVDPPATAILGMGRVAQRPVVTEGVLAVAWTVALVVSFDHRFIDGAHAAQFLAALGAYFEEPERML